jgi:hypothetical protein
VRRIGSFYVILTAFLAVFVAVLAYTVSRGRIGTPADPALAIPHGPAEFPEIFGVNPLEGLDEVGAEINVPRPPLDPAYWPCSECHAPEDANPERRDLVDDHENIELRHDEENRWCLDCHDLQNRDRLRLASGKLIKFEESYRLCGQCHGTIYRDWRAGIHGLRTGYWNGPKRYLLCVHCHSPHAPRFAPLKPLPAPVRPEYLGLKLAQRPGASRAVAPAAQPTTTTRSDEHE